VMACLLRYKAVFHPNGGNWQAAQPHGIFELWASRYFALFCRLPPLALIALRTGWEQLSSALRLP